MVSNQKIRATDAFSDSNDEGIFLASFAKILSKKGNEVLDFLTFEEAKRFRR